MKCSSPQPKVGSAIIKLTSKKEISDADFIIPQLYLQRDKKLLNALREAIIKRFSKTKKEARAVVDEKFDDISDNVLDKPVYSLSFEEIEKTFKLEKHTKL